ncbi:unnamed protein product [Clonostachys chloroleuca]|uniref:GH16 domain-containing protein n=1 Tax=Clonostachys chloroleuca TaxID=1926264 RepID=A0AA35PZJ5_9HYPO|nr:unnamed protein product [Clonostachys chloroleuca]
MVAKTLFTAIALAGLSAAQTYTDCNPTEKECPAAPALGNKKIDCDLTAGMCDGFTQLDTLTNVTYSEKGALFRIDNEDQAPTFASDKYIFFGHVEVEVQAAAGQGIVTAIVLLSADLDEIDWEWVGGTDGEVQSNCFGRAGVNTTYTCVSDHAVSKPYTTYHTYGFDWTSSKLDWLIDGEVVRTLAFEDAVGGTRFPQTPSQVKIGTWVGGKSSNSDGLIWWAGGLTDFNDAPFDAYFKSVKVTDYAGGNSAAEESILEYGYTDMSGTWQGIEVVKGEAVSSSSSSSTVPATTASEKSSSSTKSPTVSNTSATSESTSSADSSPIKSPVGSTTQTTAVSQSTPSSSVAVSNTVSYTPIETNTPVEISATNSLHSDTITSSNPTIIQTPSPSTTPSSSAAEEQLTTSTLFSTSIYTVTSCAPTVTDCPADSTVLVTSTVPILTTVCPVSASASGPASRAQTQTESSYVSAPTGGSNEILTTSTIFTTSVHTVTSCAPTVTDCPADSTVLATETIPVSTTIFPIPASTAASQSNNFPALPSNVEDQYTTSTIYATSTRTVTSCAPTVKNCPADSTKLVTETLAISTAIHLISSASPKPTLGTTVIPDVKDTQSVKPTVGSPLSTASRLSSNAPAVPSTSGSSPLPSTIVFATPSHFSHSLNSTATQLPLPTAGGVRLGRGIELATVLALAIVLVV